MAWDLDAELTPGDVQQMNDDWRATAKSAADRTALADYLGVSRRTVERWDTQGAQQRNIVPQSAAGSSLRDLMDTPEGQRAFAAAGVSGGVERAEQGIKPASYGTTFPNLADALEYAQDLMTGELDPFLKEAWGSWSVSQDGDEWNFDFDYSRLPFSLYDEDGRPL